MNKMRLHEVDRVNTLLFGVIERKFGHPLTALDLAHIITVYEFEDRIDLYWDTQWMGEMLYNPPIQYDEKYSISFYWNPKFEKPKQL